MPSAPSSVLSGLGLGPQLREMARSLELEARALARDAFPGRRPSLRPGEGVEVHDVRPYRTGDDPRRIHGRLSARRGSPHVVRTREERGGVLLLLLDVSPSTEASWTGVPWRKRRLAAALALAGIGGGDRVGLVTFARAVEQTVAPGKGRKHLLHLFHGIAASPPSPEPGTNLGAALSAAPRLVTGDSALLVLTDLDLGNQAGDLPGHDAQLRRLAGASRRHDLVLLALSPPRLDGVGGSLLLRDPEGDAKTLALVDTRRMKRMSSRWSALLGELRRRGIPVVPVPPEGSLTQVLRSVARGRAGRSSGEA